MWMNPFKALEDILETDPGPGWQLSCLICLQEVFEGLEGVLFLGRVLLRVHVGLVLEAAIGLYEIALAPTSGRQVLLSFLSSSKLVCSSSKAT